MENNYFNEIYFPAKYNNFRKGRCKRKNRLRIAETDIYFACFFIEKQLFMQKYLFISKANAIFAASLNNRVKQMQLFLLTN